LEVIVRKTHQIPLFPLGLVLLPDMMLPLHIFEERYKEMVSACLANDRPFGIVLFDGGAIRSVGCMARITEVLKRYDDGRMDIMTRGGERFVIRELIEEQAYMEARVFFFDDGEDPPGDDLADVVDAAGICSRRSPASMPISMRRPSTVTSRRNSFHLPLRPWKVSPPLNARAFWK
jgi:Lon protease-like protein